MIILGSTLLIFSASTAQSGNAQYFQDNFYRLGESSPPVIHFLPDNSLIYSSTYNRLQLGLMRISATGDTLWSKLYDSHTPIGGDPMIKTLPDVDGTLFTVCDSKRLMWTDMSGNLLRTVAISGENLYRFFDAAIMPNGDKILLFQANYNVTPGAMIIRTNKDASTVIWSKFVGGAGAKYFTDNTNMVVDGNQITMGGSWVDGATGNSSAFLGILNADDGSWIRSVIYDTPLGYCFSKKIYKTGNGYILFGWASFNNVSTGTSCYLRLNADLEVTASKRITESMDSWEGFWPIVPQADGSFYGTYGGMYDLTVYQISNQDVVTWAKIQPNNLSYPYDIQQNGNGLFVTGDQPYDNTGSAGTDVNLFLSKSDLNGEMPECPSVPRNDLLLTDIVFSGTPVSIPIQDYSATLEMSTITVSDNPMDFHNLCRAADSCHLSIDLGKDTTLCEGTEKLLNAYNAGAVYSWQDGSSNPKFTVKSPGVYAVTVNMNGCIAHDSISIAYLQLPKIETDNEVRLCNGKQITLEPTVQNADEIIWQDGSATSTYLAKDTGYYSIQAKNSCGSAMKDVHVSGGVCNIHMPAAFSPDHNGINDRFEVKYPFPVNSFSLSVYNRWGQRVFETHDISQGWDGKIKGEDASVGGYVWFISVQYTDNTSENWHGTVLLLR